MTRNYCGALYVLNRLGDLKSHDGKRDNGSYAGRKLYFIYVKVDCAEKFQEFHSIVFAT